MTGKTSEARDKETGRICLIAPTDELAQKSRELIRTYKKEISVYRASLKDAARMGEELLGKGARIFISRRGTKQLLEKQFHVQTVEIGMTLADYVSPMRKAARTEGKVAFFAYERIPADVVTMCELQGIRASYYSFLTLEECREAVRQAVREGAALGIGGADSEQFAREEGLPHMVVESSEDSLLLAMETAEQLLALQKEEEQKRRQLKLRLRRYQLIFDYTHDAILAVDENGARELLNEKARELLGIGKGTDGERAVAKAVRDTRMLEVLRTGKPSLNSLLQINGTLVSANLLPIEVEGQKKGVLATFQDVKALQDSEQKIRVKLHQKGLTAKYHFEDITGASPRMRDAVGLAEKFARSDATILIQGETGTGKELFAQSIHNASARAEGPFVAVNCGAFPRNLLEAELFGYVEGAFTGASRGGKMGLFEMAHRGTIFLDEIGEMPVETQVQLLRVLQEKEIRRIGSDKITPVDIRVITATNRNLREEIQKKNFREDLYYRLNVLHIQLPPLRDRGNDIRLLGRHLFEDYSGEADAEQEKILDELLDGMSGYDWPGNVRELGNMMERISVLLGQGESPAFVKRYISGFFLRGEEDSRETVPEGRREDEELGDWERSRIIEALKKTGLDMGRTAELLGVSRSTLWRKIKKYNIECGKK